MHASLSTYEEIECPTSDHVPAGVGANKPRRNLDRSPRFPGNIVANRFAINYALSTHRAILPALRGQPPSPGRESDACVRPFAGVLTPLSKQRERCRSPSLKS